MLQLWAPLAMKICRHFETPRRPDCQLLAIWSETHTHSPKKKMDLAEPCGHFYMGFDSNRGMVVITGVGGEELVQPKF